MLRIGKNSDMRSGLIIALEDSPSITQQIPICKKRRQISSTIAGGISSRCRILSCSETYAPPPATIPSNESCSNSSFGIFPRERPELIQIRCPSACACRKTAAFSSEVVELPQVSVPSMSRNTAYLILSISSLPAIPHHTVRICLPRGPRIKMPRHIDRITRHLQNIFIISRGADGFNSQ